MASPTFEAALPPPPGVTPHLANPQSSSSQRTAFVIGNIICLTVPTILVFLRVFVKAYIVKDFKWADYVCLVAWCCFVPFVAVALWMLKFGLDIHAWNLSAEIYSKFAESQNIHQLVYMPSILLTKVAILLQLLDIFVTQKRNYRWYTILTLIGANVVFFTILFFMEIFQCIPREKIWNPKVPGKCIDIQNTFVATGVINVCDDFIILILPVYWVWLLKISPKKKAGISLIFAAGVFACVCSIMRLLESIRNIGSLDITVTLPPVTLWAVAEVSSGLVVGCLPSLPRLFVRQRPQHGSAPTYTSNDTSLAKSKKSYVEMDDLSFPHLPSTITDEETQHLPSYGGLDHPHNPADIRRPQIVKTVSINQTSTNGL